jgi:DNA-directed RNA polymerase specialized sigma24 family protein
VRLRLPLGTVKTRTRRALAHLADRLAAERVTG